MFSHDRRLFALVLFLLLIPVLIPSSIAADEDASSMASKIVRLEKKLSTIEATQNRIIEKQEQILKELNTLRVWVRRN